MVVQGDTMRTLQFAIVLVATAGLTLWRGVALYRQTFHRKQL
jgi:hypothetical protein